MNVLPLGRCGFCDPPRPAWTTFQELVDRLYEDDLDGWEFIPDLPSCAPDDALSTEEVLTRDGNPRREPALVEALADEFDAEGYWYDLS